MSPKAAGLGIMSPEVANLLDGPMDRENGGKSQARSEFPQFRREEMMRLDKAWLGRKERLSDISKRELCNICSTEDKGEGRLKDITDM